MKSRRGQISCPTFFAIFSSRAVNETLRDFHTLDGTEKCSPVPSILIFIDECKYLKNK